MYSRVAAVTFGSDARSICQHVCPWSIRNSSRCCNRITFFSHVRRPQANSITQMRCDIPVFTRNGNCCVWAMYKKYCSLASDFRSSFAILISWPPQSPVCLEKYVCRCPFCQSKICGFFEQSANVFPKTTRCFCWCVFPIMCFFGLMFCDCHRHQFSQECRI